MAKKRPTVAETASSREPRSSFWRRQIEECAASGLSPEEFCRHRNLSVASLKWWRWKLRSSPAAAREASAVALPAEPPPSSAVPAFLPVRLVSHGERPGASSGPRSATYEVALRNGHRIRVAADFEPAVLTRLIRAVEAASC